MAFEAINSEGIVFSENIVMTNSTASTFPSAINVFRSRMSRLDCNIMASSDSEGSGIGIHVQDCPEMWYNCNDLEDFGTTVQFQGICTGTNFKVQDIGDSYAGLLLGSEIIGSEAVVGVQTLHGNLWTGQYNWKGGWHYSNDVDIIAESRFNINSNESDTYPPNIEELEDKKWFQDLGTGVSEICTVPYQYFCGEDSPVLPMDNISRITPDTFAAFNAAKKYLWERQLFRQILSETVDTTGFAYLDSFFNANVTTPIGKSTTLEHHLRGAFKVSPQDSTTRANYITTRSETKDSLQVRQISLYSADSLGKINLYTEIDSIMDILDSIRVPYALWVDTIYAQFDSVLDWIADTNDIIVPRNAAETIDVDVLDILLGSIDGDNISIRPIDSTALYAIASQCAFEGGPGVYRARALYALVDTSVVFEDSVICGTSQQGSEPAPTSIPEIPNINEISIYPNPSAPGTTLHIRTSHRITRVEIFDFTGRPCGTYYLRDDRTSTLILNDLSAGMYIVAMYNNEELQGCGKLVIQAQY